MDVFLEPLIDELNQIWEGVPNVHDCSSKQQNKTFTLRGILLWTMTDYPGIFLSLN
jgi:hypothetical protein